MRERSFRSVWLSDLHLGNADCRALWLLDFLDACTCEQLYLVGDVLDLWEMDRRGRWPAAHGRVLAKLIALAAAGTRVVWLPGNHDEALRAHHGLRFGGVELLPEAIHETA
ncbi:MAG TPA: metallophosphoesterase, partial [Plasticicumulans sp.]|nr:metallophosphoesterase [Plasticicumulans sp.]